MSLYKGNQIKIISLGMAVPERSYTQAETFERLGYPREWKRVFTDSGIDKRHFWVPIGTKMTFQEACEEYPKAVLKLGTEAIRNCIGYRTMLEIDYMIFQSCTGYQCPSMAYQLGKQVGISPYTEFISNVGDGGCVGAVPSLREAWKHTMMTGNESLAVSCEVSSLCYYPDEQPFPDPTNRYQLLRANAIFGDGASAALIGYDNNPMHPYFIDFASYTDYRNQDLLGFEWKNGRLACVLSNKVPDVAPLIIDRCITPMLRRYDLKLSDIKWFMCHPGGKKVLDNIKKYFDLDEEQMKNSREALRLYGNCSSTSVGLLSKVMVRDRGNEIKDGDWGLVTTVGSGMSCCALLLRWTF